MIKIRLYSENQLPRLPGSALEVPVVGGRVVGSYTLSSQAPTHVEVELGWDNFPIGKFMICCYINIIIFTQPILQGRRALSTDRNLGVGGMLRNQSCDWSVCLGHR